MKRLASMMIGSAIALMVLLLGSGQVAGNDTASKADDQASAEYTLPLPRLVDTVLENAIAMRKSHRVFSEDAVTDEELSTVLWSAYGRRDDGTRTVAAIDAVHGVVIYVLKEDGAYTYNPDDHTLVLYKEGDYRIYYKNYARIYMAPVQIVLCWDTEKAGLFQAAAEMGEIGQTIMLTAVSLGMGTVVTAQSPASFELMGLPEHELGIILMPLGHLKTTYRFKNQPFRLSMLDPVAFSDMTLSTAVQETTGASSLGGTLSWQEKSQLLWAAYGFSPLRDRQWGFIYVPRHRTVPSPHYAYDGAIMYVVMEDGIYRYSAFCSLLMPGQPVIDFLIKVADGDKRGAVAQACSQPSIATAPLSILSVLDVEKTRAALGVAASTQVEYYWPLLYFVAGASAHNTLLQATALHLQGHITYPPDPEALLSLLGLNAEGFQSLLVVSVGSEVD